MSNTAREVGTFQSNMVLQADFGQLNAEPQFTIQANGIKTEQKVISPQLGQKSVDFQHHCSSEEAKQLFEETPLLVAVITYIGYGVLVCFGYFRDLLRFLELDRTKQAQEKGNKVYPSNFLLPYIFR